MKLRFTVLFTVIFLFLQSNIGLCLDNAKVYLLLAIDSGQADNVGTTVVADGINVRQLFEDNIPANRLNVRNIADSNLSEIKILDSINNVPAQKDDCIILYYSGHGAFDERQGHYFQMQNGTSPLRSTFLNALKAKDVRLVVFITDCCNVQANIPAPKTGSGGLMSTDKTAIFSPLFRTLFLESQGLADITAAKIGQCSFIYGKADKRGSIFTWQLCRILEHEKNTQKNWQTIFDMVAVASNRDFRNENPKGVEIPPDRKIQREMNPFQWSLPETKTINELPRQRKKLGVRAENTPFGDGVKIIDILPNSAGEQAGLHITDTIIEINGQPVRNEEDYVRAVSTSPATMQIKVKTTRGKILIGTAQLQ
ncbi:MAG: caspase family protein [Planctomycetaceae bacterium]|nr:caspase family protein [Planctomycetaceae bacterium]